MPPIGKWLLRIAPWYDPKAAERRERHSLALVARADTVLDRVEATTADYRRADAKLRRAKR